MKLLYVVYTKIPTSKAHGLQVAQTCEELAKQGTEVELIVARDFFKLNSDLFNFYHLERKFKVIQLPVFSPKNFGQLGLLIKIISFIFFALSFIIFKKTDIIYVRGVYYCYLISFFRKNIFLELHSLRSPRFIMKRILNKCAGIICITKGIRDICINDYKINPAKFLIAADGVDLKKFNLNISKTEARTKLNLAQGKKIILYTGSFYIFDWKGIDILLDSAKYFSQDYIIMLVGGKKDEIEQIKIKYNWANVLLITQKPNIEIPFYLKAADVLVLPNKKGDSTSEKYTSPLKMFEYMASKRPIIASDLPSIREILNDQNSILVEPNDPQKLAQGIKKALTDQVTSQKITQQAFGDVQNYTWEKRAEKILSFISKQ